MGKKKRMRYVICTLLGILLAVYIILLFGFMITDCIKMRSDNCIESWYYNYRPIIYDESNLLTNPFISYLNYREYKSCLEKKKINPVMAYKTVFKKYVIDLANSGYDFDTIIRSSSHKDFSDICGGDAYGDSIDDEFSNDFRTKERRHYLLYKFIKNNCVSMSCKKTISDYTKTKEYHDEFMPDVKTNVIGN